MNPTTYIKKISELTPNDTSLYGWKAMGLSKLIQAWFSTPDGLAISYMITKNTDWLDNIACIISQEFAWKKIAIRSSWIGEDSWEASFSGIYNTRLDVNSSSSKAIKQALKYVMAQKKTYISTVIQPMIDVSISWIAFTHDPIAISLPMSIITATKWTWEKLVGGEISGNPYIVQRDTGAIISGTSNILNKKQINNILEQLRKVYNIFWCPMDIERCIDTTWELQILQSRPIVYKQYKKQKTSSIWYEKYITRPIDFFTEQCMHEWRCNFTNEVLGKKIMKRMLIVNEWIADIYVDMEDQKLLMDYIFTLICNDQLIPLWKKCKHDCDTASKEIKKISDSKIKLKSVVSQMQTIFEKLSISLIIPRIIWMVYEKYNVCYKKKETLALFNKVNESRRTIIDDMYMPLWERIKNKVTWWKDIAFLLPTEIQQYIENPSYVSKLTTLSKKRKSKSLYTFYDGKYKIRTGFDENKIPKPDTRTDKGIVSWISIDTRKLNTLTWKVIIIRTKQDYQRIEPWNIVVSAMTTPDLMAKQKNIAGVITDEWSILCHAGNLAREYGIPTIMGTKDATKILKNWDIVIMNMTNWTVIKK